MQRLTRRSSALSSSTEHSDSGTQGNREEQILDVENRPRKRPTTDVVNLDRVAQTKRARRTSSKSKDGDEDVGDFIVVASSKSSQDPWSSRHQQNGRDCSSNSPILPSSSVSSLGLVGSPVASYEATIGGLDTTKRVSTNIQDTSTTTTDLARIKYDPSMELIDASCPEPSNSSLPTGAKDGTACPTTESLHNQPARRSSPESKFPAVSDTREVTSHQSPTLTPWVAVNAPSSRKPLSSSGNSHQDSRPREGSQEFQKSSAATKRTPLPADKGDSQLAVSKVLTNIPRDPRYALTKPPKRTSSREEVGAAAAATAATAATATAEVEGVGNPQSDAESVNRSASPARASTESLHKLYSPVSGLDSKSRQPCASGQSTASLRSELLTATTDPTVQTPRRSNSVENGLIPVPFQDALAFSIFPSNFQVTTADSVEQSQSFGQKRRHRRKNTSEETRRVASPPVDPHDTYHQGHATIEQEPATNAKLILGRKTSVFPDVVSPEMTAQQSNLPALEPTPRSTNVALSTMTEKAASRFPSSYTAKPQSVPLSQIYCPPAVEFTIDNRAESILPASEVTSLFASLSKNASVLLVPNALHSSNTYPSQPIGILMWQTLPGFYSWYSNLTGVNMTWSLKFELMDVHWQSQKSFVLPHNNLDCFRALKQYIWDFYWMATSVNHGVSPFRVSIAAYPVDAERAALNDSRSMEWHPESPHEVSDFQRQSQILPSIRSQHEPRNESILNPVAEDQARRAPHERGSCGAGSTPILLDTTGFPSSSMVASPTAASPLGLNHSVRSSSGHSHPDAASWHSHRIPTQSSMDRTTNTDNVQPHPSHQAWQSSIEHVRTDLHKAALRKRALELLPQDMELFPEESTVYDKLPYKTGAQVLGAVIDKMSGIGTVSITGKGYITLNIPTGLEEVDDRYQRVNINAKQTCMLHKGAIVVYYKRRESIESIAPLSRSSNMEIELSSSHTAPPSAKVPSLYSEVFKGTPAPSISPPTHNYSQSIPPEKVIEPTISVSRPAEVTILIRLQVERSGKFSVPFDKSFLRPSITVTEFFSWFASNSGHAKPGPNTLKFVFKDAMPAPTSTQITRGNEDHFKLMRKDIKVQCAKAKAFMPDLKEFVILITVPGWGDVTEEDW